MSDLPRKPGEIVARIAEVAARDISGIERSRLLDSLPWQDATQFLHPGSREPVEWEESRIRTTERALELVRAHLGHAWSRACMRRGHAIRLAMCHFRGLLWLLGDNYARALQSAESGPEPAYYGKPQLVAISEAVGFPWRDHDDDRWVVADGDEPLTAAAVLGRPEQSAG